MPQPKSSGTSSKRSAPAKKAPVRKSSKPPAASPAAASVRESSTGLRDTLGRGIILTRERINETLDDAVRRGRMTREDAEELAASLVGIGRRQAQDLLADVEALLGLGRRRTVGTDVLVRQVDKARRAAGLGASFPILGYEELTAAQVTERLSALSGAELRKVRAHERRNANRKSVLAAVDRALG